MYFEVFQGLNDHWYWRLYSSENKKVAFSTEGYYTQKDVLDVIKEVKSIASIAPVRQLKFSF